MAADLFETFAVTLIATMLLGALVVKTTTDAALILSARIGRRIDHRFNHRLHVRQGGSRARRS